MSERFRRQMMDYVVYHRDPMNGLLHVIGIVFLFLGAMLPLSLWHFDAFGLKISLGAIMALPVLVYWMLLDAALGTAILAGAIALLAVAMIIVDHVGGVAMWSIFVGLLVLGFASQAVGHRVFEGNNPSALDHPAHLWLGPMFVMAKLFIACGFRPDLAAIFAPTASPGSLASDRLQGDQRAHP